MPIPYRAKQVNLRVPLPLLTQIKSAAEAKQQAIADWILALVRRELDLKSQNPQVTDRFVLHSELLVYMENYLAPLQSQIIELRTQLGESKA